MHRSGWIVLCLTPAGVVSSRSLPSPTFDPAPLKDKAAILSARAILATAKP